MNAYAADFGPLVVADDVNQSVLDAFRYWLPTQIHQVEIERNIPNGTIARPKPQSYATVRLEGDWGDHELPAILVECAGTEAVKQLNANGVYLADWRIQITVVYRGRTYPETQKYASLFEGAVRRTMLMQPNQLAGRAWWLGTDPIRPVVDVADSGRYMCAAISHFKVAVDDVAQSGAGPTVPSDPYPDPPVDDPDVTYEGLAEVDSVILTVDGLSPSQQIGG
jgi:hypothetical protein